MSPKLTYILIGWLLIFLGTACERDTKFDIVGSNPPRFVMRGSGTLALLRMHGPKVRADEGEAAYIIWEITPRAGRLNGKRVEGLGSITYGMVPSDYVQVYPESGSPPQLIENEEYDVFIDTAGANGARKYFTIHDGKVVEKVVSR